MTRRRWQQVTYLHYRLRQPGTEPQKDIGSTERCSGREVVRYTLHQRGRQQTRQQGRYLYQRRSEWRGCFCGYVVVDNPCAFDNLCFKWREWPRQYSHRVTRCVNTEEDGDEVRPGGNDWGPQSGTPGNQASMRKNEDNLPLSVAW